MPSNQVWMRVSMATKPPVAKAAGNIHPSLTLTFLECVRDGWSVYVCVTHSNINIDSKEQISIVNILPQFTSWKIWTLTRWLLCKQWLLCRSFYLYVILYCLGWEIVTHHCAEKHNLCTNWTMLYSSTCGWKSGHANHHDINLNWLWGKIRSGLRLDVESVIWATVSINADPNMNLNQLTV